MARTRLVAACLTVAILVAGCGVYSFDPRGKSDISTIAIEPLDNETTEFGLTDRLTELIIDAFIADGKLKVVAPEQADAVLTGTLKYYDRQPSAFDENDQVTIYKVVLDFDMTLKNPDADSDYWSQRMRQEGFYDATTEIEEDGQRDASAKLVEDIINKTTKSW